MRWILKRTGMQGRGENWISPRKPTDLRHIRMFAHWETFPLRLNRGRGESVVRLLAPYLGEPGSIPGRPCSTMPLVGGSSWGSPVSTLLHSGAALYSPRLTFIGSEDLAVKRHPNLSTPLIRRHWEFICPMDVSSSCPTDESEELQRRMRNTLSMLGVQCCEDIVLRATRGRSLIAQRLHSSVESGRPRARRFHRRRRERRVCAGGGGCRHLPVLQTLLLIKSRLFLILSCHRISARGIRADNAVGRLVFSGISRLPRPPSFRRRSLFTSIALITSQDLAVNGEERYPVIPSPPPPGSSLAAIFPVRSRAGGLHGSKDGRTDGLGRADRLAACGCGPWTAARQATVALLAAKLPTVSQLAGRGLPFERGATGFNCRAQTREFIPVGGDVARQLTPQDTCNELHCGYWLLLRAPRMYSTEQAPAYLATLHPTPLLFITVKRFRVIASQEAHESSAAECNVRRVTATTRGRAATEATPPCRSGSPGIPARGSPHVPSLCEPLQVKAVHNEARTFEINLRIMSLPLPAYISTGAPSEMCPIGGKTSGLRRLDGGEMPDLLWLDGGKTPDQWRLDGTRCRTCDVGPAAVGWGKMPDLRWLDGGKMLGLQRLNGGKTPDLWRLDGGKMLGLRRLDGGKTSGLRRLDGGKTSDLRRVDGGKTPGLRRLDGARCRTCGD
ncbi:hypothetical protein PR048_019124 [Dryococelus australis]|uniref:Uncharacterized protein n=1 Tax=Dryococelus australis TaxID=614101 RepID=A0ABQ9H2N2_9NEOP|nr:hypothetical protein PR048_019124 [Dryococelus australis]